LSLPASRTGDNDVDNVEQVKIDNPPAGQYTITVSRKGSLVTGNQKFSLTNDYFNVRNFINEVLILF
jgi:hypothetical protein